MSGLDDAIGELWLVFAPTARARVDLLEQYAAALADGRDDAPLRTDAASAAHKLAGALGSYLRPGSDQAAALEDLLRREGEVTADEVAPLVRSLRLAVDG